MTGPLSKGVLRTAELATFFPWGEPRPCRTTEPPPRPFGQWYGDRPSAMMLLGMEDGEARDALPQLQLVPRRKPM